MYATDNPFGQFFDLDGSPLSAGQLFYGAANQNPLTSPIPVYWDAAGTLPAAQPVGTLNGYPVRSGTPTLIFAASTYSLLVRNKKGQTVFYLADSSSLPSALEGRLASITSALYGAGAIGYDQALAYATPSAGYRMRQTITAKNAGCDITGDVYTSLSAALTLASSLGATFEFTAGRTYQLAQALTFPAGLVVRANGATLQDLNGTTSNTAFVVVGAACVIDALVVNIPAGKRRDRAVVLNGDGASVGSIRVVSADQQVTDTDLNDCAVAITADDITVGSIYVENVDRAVRIDTCSRVTIGRIDCVSWVRACWIHDASYVKIIGGHMRTASPNATLDPGNNGYLIGSDTAGTSHNITITDPIIEDAGEHGIRIGGPETIRNVFITRPQILAPGACGIKCRGSDGTPINYNYNIVIDSPVIEDCGTSVTASLNRCGILVEWVAGAQIISPSIRQRDNANCASFGIRVNASNDVEISNPTIHTPQYDCILIHADEADVSRVNIIGGALYNAARNALSLFVSATMTARNIHASGPLLQSATNFGFIVSNAGTISDANMAIRTHSTTAGAVSCSDTAVILQVSGIPGATLKSAVAAADGSTWLDNAAGNFFVLKAGTWTAAS